MNRTTGKYLALLALAVIIFHWKILLTDQFTTIVGGEGVNQTYGWLHFWVRSIWSGHLPLWDPYAWAGRPFVGESQTSAYYPLRLLFALVPFNKNDLVSPRFYHEYLAFTRFLGAVFMFALLRELRRSRFAAFIGASAFSMGGFVSRIPWPHYIEACTWLPAVFLFMLRAFRMENRLRALLEASLCGLCLGMSALTGGVQFTMIEGICIAGAVFYYGAVSSAGPQWRERWFLPVTILGTVMVVALCAGAAQIFPLGEYSHLSLRGISGGYFPMSEKIPYDRMVRGMWPESILSTLIPVGAPVGGEEAWPSYVGALPLFFAVIAIWKCWSNLWVRYIAIMAVLVFAYTLGEFSPLFGALYAIVPYLWMARGASRFVLLLSFAIATLSAFGLDALLDGVGQRDSWAPARPFLKWISILCAAAIALPGVFTQISLNIWTCMSLVLIMGSCAWCWRLSLRHAPTSLRVMMAMFVLFDLGALNWLESNKNELSKNGDLYVQMVTMKGAADFIKSQPGLNRVRTEVNPEPNLGDFYGIQSIWGGGSTTLMNYSRLSLHEELLNVRYRIRPQYAPEPGEVYRDAKWKVYENRKAFPRAWMVYQTVIEPTDEAAYARIDKADLDLHKVAIVERALPKPLDPSTAGDSLRFRSYGADSMALDVHAGGTALLVLSEMYYPGWRAAVNGQTAEIVKVDGGLRGIVVPAGTSRVELNFVPVVAYAGLGLSFVTIVGAPLAWLFFRRRNIA